MRGVLISMKKEKKKKKSPEVVSFFLRILSVIGRLALFSFYVIARAVYEFLCVCNILSKPVVGSRLN